jgi:hypothetical protein
MTDPYAVAPSSPTTWKSDRIIRWILMAIGVYSVGLVSLINLVILRSGKTEERAIILMADGMILLWLVLGGAMTPWLRTRLVPRISSIPLDWRARFVLFATIMALTEEAITTTMTNCAPLLGTTPEAAHITASTNYLHVVLCHSVIMFVPLFFAWALMLSRWDFSPLAVLLLFGITGSLAEMSINPQSVIGGFWVFVYGLMVYLPACTVPRDREKRPARLWHYPMAVLLPFPFVILTAPFVPLLKRALGVQFFPGL